MSRKSTKNIWTDKTRLYDCWKNVVHLWNSNEMASGQAGWSKKSPKLFAVKKNVRIFAIPKSRKLFRYQGNRGCGEMVDTLLWGGSGRWPVWVRVSPTAQRGDSRRNLLFFVCGNTRGLLLYHAGRLRRECPVIPPVCTPQAFSCTIRMG